MQYLIAFLALLLTLATAWANPVFRVAPALPPRAGVLRGPGPATVQGMLGRYGAQPILQLQAPPSARTLPGYAFVPGPVIVPAQPQPEPNGPGIMGQFILDMHRTYGPSLAPSLIAQVAGHPSGQAAIQLGQNTGTPVSIQALVRDRILPPVQARPPLERTQELFQQHGVCRGGCDASSAGIGVGAVQGDREQYTGTYMICPQCGTRAGVIEGTDGFRRETVVPTGNTMRARLLMRDRYDVVTGRPTEWTPAEAAQYEAMSQAGANAALQGPRVVN